MKMPHSIRQLFDFEKHELRIVVLSASYFFLLLCAYYILRPIREAMGIARNADDLPSLFLATMLVTFLLAPVIGALVSRYRRNQFIPIAYHFIAANLLLFFIALKFVSAENLFTVGIIFYVWLTVINLLLVSLFWGFMSDGISFEKSKKLFPAIAVGGTLGAIFGSNITRMFVELVGQSYLLLVAIAFLYLAIKVMKMIDREFADSSLKPVLETTIIVDSLKPVTDEKNNKSQISLWTSGIRFAFSSPYILAIAGYIFFYSITSTFLYFQQGQLVSNVTDVPFERIEIFANIDIWTNILTLLMQLFISSQLLKKFGIGIILLGLPLLTLIGFISLSIYQTIAILIVFQSVRRALNYGLFKPAREMLFTLIPTEQKYKAKSFLDTFIYRSGDAIGALTQKGLIALQLGAGSIALLVVPIAAIWSVLALFLGIQASLINKNNQSKQMEKNND